MNKKFQIIFSAVAILTFAVLTLGMITALAHPSGLSTLGDYVWFDADGDGVKDSTAEWDDLGIDGVLVNLYMDNGTTEGVFDANDTLMKHMLTGDNPSTGVVEHGWYDFIELGEGISWWVEIPDSNFEHGGPLEGYEYTGNNSDVWPYNGDNPRYYHTPPNISDYNDMDFSFTLKDKVSIGNIAWFDADKDSVYDDTTESGIGGVTMFLLRDENGNGLCEPGGPDGRILMTTTTMITVTEAPIITATVGITNPAVVTTTTGITTPTNITFTADIITPTVGMYQFQDVKPSDDVTNTSTYSSSYYCVAVLSASLIDKGYTNSSAGGNHAPDTADNDDDGTVYNGLGYVVSNPLRASKGGQDPSVQESDSGDPDGYADGSSYMTVDFGFIKTPDAVDLVSIRAVSGFPWGFGVGLVGLFGLIAFAWRRRQ